VGDTRAHQDGSARVIPQISQIKAGKSEEQEAQNTTPARYLRDLQTYAIIGAAMRVHSELGLGFLESVYNESLEVEFLQRGIPFEREVALPVYFRDTLLKSSFRADFICFNTSIVEVKALRSLSGPEESQLINYLKAARLHKRLLINFGAKSLQFKRFAFNPPET